ncbi:MAG: hypothetical protein J6S34_01080 [Clostridia bacterium]|nr:hypothetical protein [Clostridia bacterium]
MSKKLYPKIEGKTINVKNLTISSANNTLCLYLLFTADDPNNYFIVFENVSQLKLSDISFPFQICGFEIQDHSSRGYQKEARFFINDYEDGKISFWCEDYGITGKEQAE